MAARDLLKKLARPPEEIRRLHLRDWAASLPDVTPISQLVPRTRVKAAGVIQNIRIDPREGTGSVEATIIDGTGELLVKWLGRSSLSGIRLGMGLIVEGVLGTDPSGLPVILNPEYSLVAGPEHG